MDDPRNPSFDVPTPTLRARGLTRRPWIESLDLDLFPGEIRCVVGPSGSGKSLLLRGLADLDPVDAGEVALDGRDRSEIAPAAWRRAVLYVHPSGARLPGTVRDNFERLVSLGDAPLQATAPAADRRPAPPPDLEPTAPVDRLSSGEAERLALARALACAPRALLLDEPTAHLDGDRARRAEADVRAFAAAGGAVLWISHDPTLPERVGAATLELG